LEQWRVTRTAVFALIEEILASGLNIADYCRANGLKNTTLTSRALRAGVRMGVEIRRRRVEYVHELKDEHPEWTWTRCAAEAGFDMLSRFNRARRSLGKRWGIHVAPRSAPTLEERTARVLHSARQLAATVELVLRNRQFLALKYALADFREAEHLLERAS
jgi:AraC-like DNA-binding protein